MRVSSVRAGASASRQAPSLQRQTSVLHELQETHEKENLGTRNARLMGELSALCSDRSNILTAESLDYLVSEGRAEPIKLEREPEKPADATPKASSLTGRQEDLLSADAARRQRVEELTRFFMEAKSDIEFALGGNRDLRDARDKDKDGESERDEDKENETGDDDEDGDNADDTNDPERKLARLHAHQLTEKIDERVYNGMLTQIRETDPALYGAILCHPLVTGVDPKKEKRKKKKRGKDRDRKEKTQLSMTSLNAMLTPDLAAPRLTAQEMKVNIARFVARAIADGSIQGLLLATKLLLSWALESEQGDLSELQLSVATHLRVLRGEKAPELPKPRAPVALKATATELDDKVHTVAIDAAAADVAGTTAQAEALAAQDELVGEGSMDVDGGSLRLQALHARLSRFGAAHGDGDDEDEDEDEDEDRIDHDEDEDEDDEDHEGAGSADGEAVDEDALMARAIALSLSPEINLRDQSDIELSPSPALLSGPKATDPVDHTPPRPDAYSPDEVLGLGPFLLPVDGVDVSVSAAAIALLTQVSKLCLEYLESCRKGVLPSNSGVQPHPLVFMLINSVLRDLVAATPSCSQNESDAAAWKLFIACSQFAVLRALEAHLFHVDITSMSPASVGLGQIATLNNATASPVSNRLVDSLKTLVEQALVWGSRPFQAKMPSDRDTIGSVLFSRSFASSDIQRVADVYAGRVREHALVAWARGVAHFYPSQSDRHELLVSLLQECVRGVSNDGDYASWRYFQLDLLCARLSQPELVHGFVPQCGDVVISDTAAQDGSRTSVQPVDEDAKPIDDAALHGAGSTSAKKRPHWRPDVIRVSLSAGSITPRGLLDFLTEAASPELLEAAGISGLVLADSRVHDVLTRAYEQLWDARRREEQEALDCVARLPSIVDLLRQSVVQSPWPQFSVVEDLLQPHAPILPNIDRLKKSDMSRTNARLVLLRSIQDLMIQRVGGARGDEPPAMDFDPTRSAETMTLSDGNKTARQYTAKQWGMVMSTTGCPPNSGIHEWAVRLDRCEKGHIFLGVCTRDASVATYVGGDRQGWGLIGTRALWHNRSKVRGDYGDGFSTGSIVRVRLNTDSGALSFGVEDSDWGIAFDGLTQHGTLYPAIGLYQRDDQVTILPVSSSDRDRANLTGAARRGREVAVPAILHPFLHHSAAVLEATCGFLSSPEVAMAWDQARATRNCALVETVLGRHPLIFSLVTPLVSSLVTIKNFHGLSAVLGLHFIPWCTRLVRHLDRMSQQLRELRALKSGDFALDVSGDWELKSMAAGNIPAQQYHLTLTHDAEGVVTGQSTGSHSTVTLSGSVVGTRVRFLETWRQGGTCLVEGRLRADGCAFTGTYEDAKSHTSGSISGHKLKTEDRDGLSGAALSKLSVLEIISAELVGAFSRALMDCEKPDLVIDQFKPTLLADEDIVADDTSGLDTDGSAQVSSECSSDEYEGWVDSLLLSGGLPSSTVKDHLKNVLARVATLTHDHLDASFVPELATATSEWLAFVTPKAVTQDAVESDATSGLENGFVQDLISGRGDAASIDRWVSRHVGESPFLRLGGEPMKVAKRTVCAAMLWHSGFLKMISKILGSSSDDLGNSEERPHENLMHIWRAAQRVIEWAIRAKNSMGSTYAVVAAIVIRKAEFLLKIEPSAKALAASTAVSILSHDPHAIGQAPPARHAVYECAERIYSEVLMQVSRFLEAPIQIINIQSRMLAHSTRAFLRILGMLSFRYLAGDSSSPSTASRSMVPSNETIQSSFALATGLHWLSPGSRTSPLPTILKESAASDSSESPAPAAAKGESGHYLNGLGGCGKNLENDIREAFESLYGFLSALLSKATWAHDSDLQLVLLEAWGVVIQPDDHSFLSRVGIFRVLQTVLDEARSQDVSMDASAGGASVESRNRLVESRRNVVQATLKVVHLLAAQVAQAGELNDSFAVPADTAMSSFAGLAVGSIPLLRKPSGPETLGKSVFHMLYTELKNALEDIRNDTSAACGSNQLENNAIEQTEPTESGTESPDSIEDTTAVMSTTSDAEEYCYQICSLLYSVSGSPVCRSHLSSSRWLRLLLVLLELGSVAIQRRSLKLLRRILPDLDPETIKLRPDAMDVFDVDSDDEADDEDAPHDQASALVNFFVGIVSSMSPPSLVEAMLRRLPSGTGIDASSRFPLDAQPQVQPQQPSATSGLASEVVLLLRSLYASPKWSGHLSSAIVNALTGLPMDTTDKRLTKPSRDGMDSDIEMEDMSASRELPSIDAWAAESRTQLNALAALCVLDGHVEGLRVGATVKIAPKASLASQEVTFRGTTGIVVSYEPEKSSAEVLIKKSRSSDTPSTRASAGAPSRPVRVPVDDLVPVSDVELDVSVFSSDVLQMLLVEKFPFFIAEIRKSHDQLKESDVYNKNGDTSMEEPDEDDDMSNDGSSSPSGMDSDMVDHTGADSDGNESEIGSPRSGPVNLDGEIAASDVAVEMEKESQLQRMLLCQHGLRSVAMLLRDKRAAEAFIRGGGSGNLFDLLQIAISETPTAGLVEIAPLEESWVLLWARWFAMRRAAACPVPKKPVDKKSDDDASTSASEQANPMVQQMMEMGFPKEWCDVALARCSHNVEAAINFCFEHSGDMERLVAQYKTVKETVAAQGAKPGRAEADALITPLLEQLAEMGFPLNWCKKALAANRNNVDAALTWILSNGEALEAEDRREEEAKQRAIDGTNASVADEPVATADEPKPNPLRAVSGQASIGENDLMVEGLVGAGFPSVGAPDCLVSTGRWYYEATLLTNGCIQIGWADVAFCGAADRGDGVGDGSHSWAYDGWRQQKWHGQSSPWGSKWKQGDVIGCAVDVDAGTILFSLNGKMKSMNMGVAFRGVQFAHGLYPCASFNRRERLQFNMGGSPFKFPPPPGFQPILQVLCRDGETIADLPKGFAVIGRREDCLEEAIGEENYTSDARYFGRELHSTIARSTGTNHHLSRGTLVMTATRADMFAELRAIPDDRVHTELLLLSRSLAVLHARRALLTLLAKWPSELVGAFSMDCFAASHGQSSSSAASLFIDFIKLIASCNGGGGGGSGGAGSAVAYSVDAANINELLVSSFSGRQALGLLLPVARSAMELSLSKSLSQRDQLLNVVLARVAVEVKSASGRVYARVPWDSSDASVTASFLQLSSESGQAWSDNEVLRHPNVFLAEWFSRLLMDSLSRFEDRLEESVRRSLRLELLTAWLAAFKSPGLCVKEKAFKIIGGILQDTLLKAVSHDANALASASSSRDLVQQLFEALSLDRLVDLADERLLKEYPQLPVSSRYLQSLMELVSAGSLASSLLGSSTDALFTRPVAKRLEASQKLDADLVAIHAQEYEQDQARRRVLAEEAALKAIEEEKAAQAAAAQVEAAALIAATAAAAEAAAESEELRAGGVEQGDEQMHDSEAVLAAQSADSSHSNSNANSNNNNDGSGTKMDVDSDSDDNENGDITLSAIANMVSEDRDVVAAAAAIAAASNGRLSAKQASKSKSSNEKAASASPPQVPEFEFSFPEEEIAFDTSLLNDTEKPMLEAGAQGLLGDEPMAWRFGAELGHLSDTTTQTWSGQLTQFKLADTKQGEILIPDLTVGCKVMRGPSWKWRDQDGGEGSIGVVESVSPWSGVEGEGMSVRWPNDSLYTYRWGADGNYDLVHVEVDDEGKVVVTHPTPQVRAEDEGSLGCEVHLGMRLHLFDDHDDHDVTEREDAGDERKISGVLEWPDYGASVRVVGRKYADASVVVQELQLLRGYPDMGWTLRFGTEKWQPGTKYTLRPVGDAAHGEMAGEFTNMARRHGKLVQVCGEIRLSTKSLFTMDAYNHFTSLTISDAGMTVTCNSGESRNLALGTVGFATGIHYWEVRVDQAEFGSVFIGVCEKAGPPGSQTALANRLNRWTGWGFVNFRATYHNSTERIYGDHFNAGDTIGVCLDMEQGKLSFFMDGMKFGEHIVADLGVAFENMKGERNARTLYPCIGMRKAGDRVALNGKWVSVPGVSSRQLLCDALDVSAGLHSWYLAAHSPQSHQPSVQVSDELLRESWFEWKRWNENRWQRYPARPRGAVVDFDTYPSSCMAVSTAAGLSAPFLAGDRVRISSTYGRELTQPEEAVILGVYRNHLWYRTETQGNEGADEGRSWAWYFTASELAELLLLRRNGKDMTLMENSATDLDESLAMEACFIARSDQERHAQSCFETFVKLATESHSPASDMQLVERLNTFCAASGVDITNLRIEDVLTPQESLDVSRRTGTTNGRSRTTQTFIPDDYFASPALKPLSGPELRARCAVLRVFNGKVTRALPLIALQASESCKDVIDVAPTGRSSSSAAHYLSSAAAYPSISMKLCSLRRLIFTSTKRSFWDAVLRATTTTTPLPSDEYEDPREIRTIRINRIQAQASKLSLLAQPSDRLRRSVFGQLYREMRTWNDSSFRRAYCGKGHGGQRRAFKVKFLGEGVNDYGGPYRAVFEQVVDELQLDNVELSKGEQGLLPLLIPCPNRRSGTGINQDKFLLNPSCGTSLVANGPIALDLHRFLGKVVGTAVRHGLQMGLDLPSLVWRPLAGLDVGRAHLESVDVVATNNLTRVDQVDGGDTTTTTNGQETLEYLTFTTTLSDGSEVALCPNGDQTPVTLANKALYVELVEKKRLTESQQQLAALRDGLSAVLPMELATLFTPRELEVLICGRREVDVELLRQCTEYGEGMDDTMPHVEAFWQVLSEMSSDERTSFLRFVWARSRMPNSAKDFPMNFKIQTADSGAQVDPDKYLPHAQTCFFALRLPSYSSKEILRAKLLYAIQNSPNMDADVRLHNAEGWADA